MKNELLMLLEKNARLTAEELATLLDADAAAVQAQIRACEHEGVIRGYTAIVDWERTDRDQVAARIEVQVTPMKDRGFDEVAEQIASFEEVQSVYLMSGGYDLALTLVGKNFQEIAAFVAYRLAPMESVQSTATHFVLRKYKERGVVVANQQMDERGVVL